MGFKKGGYQRFREKALEYGLTEDQIYSISLSIECGLYEAAAIELFSILKENGKLNKEKETKIMEYLSICNED